MENEWGKFDMFLMLLPTDEWDGKASIS